MEISTSNLWCVVSKYEKAWSTDWDTDIPEKVYSTKEEAEAVSIEYNSKELEKQQKIFRGSTTPMITYHVEDLATRLQDIKYNATEEGKHEQQHGQRM